MKIDRRRLIELVTGFFLASNPLQLSLAKQKSLSISKKGNLPFFLGWYDYIENINVPGRVSSRGIDLLMPYIEKSKRETVDVFLNRAQQAKVKVLLEIYRPLVESRDIAGVQEFIRAYKDHPAVCGWYLYDEPEIKNPQPITPDLLIEVYRAIKVIDPVKPVALIFAEIDKIAPYSNAMDIMMWDRYPCEKTNTEFSWIAAYRASLNQVSKLAKIKKKRFVNVVQAYAGHGLNKRLPTKAEFRYMFYASVLAGTEGLLFWMYNWSTPSWNESVLYPTVKEFRGYLPSIIQRNRSKNITPANRQDIEIKLFPIPNTPKILIIAINHEKAQVDMKLKLDRQLAGKLVKSDKKIVSRISPQSDFQVKLPPYQVRLYEIG